MAYMRSSASASDRDISDAATQEETPQSTRNDASYGKPSAASSRVPIGVVNRRVAAS